MIRLESATLAYAEFDHKVEACSSLDLTVQEGEFLGILGPSGSGKSSLLYLMSGMKLPTSGRVLHRERDLAGMSDAQRSHHRLRTFGFVFQHSFLLGYLSAQENVAIASTGPIANQEALALLDQLEMGNKAHRFPHELSGGERQRVCIARALIGRPEVIFADEPTAQVDHATGLKIMELLLNFRQGRTLVVVTHDPGMLFAADRTLHLLGGRLEEPTT